MLRNMTGTIVDAYALHLTAAGARPRTVAARRQQVGALAEVGDPLAATAEDLTRWLATPDWKPNTRAAMRAAARGFYGWMVATGRRDDNPADALPPVPTWAGCCPGCAGRRSPGCGSPTCTAHTLRHRFATRAYRGSGGDILAVQQLLGHSSPATTQVYVAVDPDHLRRAAVAAG